MSYIVLNEPARAYTAEVYLKRMQGGKQITIQTHNIGEMEIYLLLIECDNVDIAKW